jgi:hypothetical protein
MAGKDATVRSGMMRGRLGGTAKAVGRVILSGLLAQVGAVC